LVAPQAQVITLLLGSITSSSHRTGIPLAMLLGDVFVMIMGLLSVPIGYLQAVHDYSHPTLTLTLIVWTQLAWIPFVTELVAMGIETQTSVDAQTFLPSAYSDDMTSTDVQILGSMGLLSIVGYGVGFWGSLALIQCSLGAFQKGRPEERPGTYYRGRLTLYAMCQLLVGGSQLTLGIYSRVRWGTGTGPLPHGPLQVAMYTIHFPEIAIVVGLVQTLNACYAFWRSCGFAVHGPDDHSLQWLTLIQWISTVVLQIMVQLAYHHHHQYTRTTTADKSTTAAAEAPSQTMRTLGLSVIVAFLDYKARTVPDHIPDNYYGGLASSFRPNNDRRMVTLGSCFLYLQRKSNAASCDNHSKEDSEDDDSTDKEVPAAEEAPAWRDAVVVLPERSIEVSEQVP